MVDRWMDDRYQCSGRTIGRDVAEIGAHTVSAHSGQSEDDVFDNSDHHHVHVHDRHNELCTLVYRLPYVYVYRYLCNEYIKKYIF